MTRHIFNTSARTRYLKCVPRTVLPSFFSEGLPWVIYASSFFERALFNFAAFCLLDYTTSVSFTVCSHLEVFFNHAFSSSLLSCVQEDRIFELLDNSNASWATFLSVTELVIIRVIYLQFRRNIIQLLSDSQTVINGNTTPTQFEWTCHQLDVITRDKCEIIFFNADSMVHRGKVG